MKCLFPKIKAVSNGQNIARSHKLQLLGLIKREGYCIPVPDLHLYLMVMAYNVEKISRLVPDWSML